LASTMNFLWWLQMMGGRERGLSGGCLACFIRTTPTKSVCEGFSGPVISL